MISFSGSAALLDQSPDDHYCLCGVGRVVSSSVLDEKWRRAIGVSGDLYQVELVLVADEVDVVVVGWVGDLLSLDDQSGQVLAQLVEYVVDLPAGAIGDRPWAASVHGYQAWTMTCGQRP
jgi:hypothetical protein